jgi:hypothetical protein
MTQSVNIGSSPIKPGETVLLDHSVRTFVISIRSFNTVGPETIKNLIESKFEVVSIQQTGQVNMITPARKPNTQY